MSATQRTVTIEDLLNLQGPRRLTIKAEMVPDAGLEARWQPAGFPELGHVIYDAPAGLDSDGNPKSKKVCVVDSPASMANHLESLCWDARTRNGLVTDLQGLPYVRLEATQQGKPNLLITSSILQDHRIASSYFTESQWPSTQGRAAEVGQNRLFRDFNLQMGSKRSIVPPASWRNIYDTLFRYDPCSLVHGVFFPQKKLGNIKIPRALTANLDAYEAHTVPYSGVKFDPIGYKHQKDTNYGQSIFAKEDVVAWTIIATFSIDAQQIRNYGLRDDETRLLLILSLWKVERFLNDAPKLRTNCVLRGRNPPQNQVDGELVQLDVLGLSEELRRLVQAIYSDHEIGPITVTRTMEELSRSAGQEEEAGEPEGASSSAP